MKITVEAQNTITGDICDVSRLFNSITIENYLSGQPGKLTCIIQKDPNNLFKINNGGVIRVVADGTPMFFGYVFTIGTDATIMYP